MGATRRLRPDSQPRESDTAGLRGQTGGMGARRRIRLVVGAVAVAVALVASSGCDPIEDQPKSFYFIGDSILFDMTLGNTSFYVHQPAGYAARVDGKPGATTADWLPSVEKYAAQDVPERLIVELGTNEARDADGWTEADADAYRTLVEAAPDRSCVVGVLPAAGPAASATVRRELRDAAEDIAEIVGERPAHHLADFATFLADHPGWVEADGIHLVDTGDQRDAVQAAYRDWIWIHALACRP